MFRLTLYGPLSDSYTLTNSGKSQWIRVYRWGNKWGEKYVGSTDDDWVCEKRKQVAHTSIMDNHMVLEETQVIECNAPPFDTDDVWDEEVYKNGNITYGNLLVLKGNKEEIYSVCKSIAPQFAEWTKEHTQSHELVDIKPSLNVVRPMVVQKTRTPINQVRVSKGPRAHNDSGFANNHRSSVRSVCLID